MSLSRRDFLAWLAVGGAAVRSSLALAYDRELFKENPKVGFPILQGMTDESSAQFTIVLPTTDTWTIAVTPQTPFLMRPQMRRSVVTRTYSDRAVHKILVENLSLGETYHLRIMNSAGTIADEREFKALNLSRRSVRIGLVSCAMDHLHRDDIWREFENQRPDIALFLGDNVYCDRKALNQKVDVPDPQLIWQRYVETRERVAFYFQKKLTPVLAIWDDHDFGGNNSSASFPYAVETRKIFDAFFAQDPRPNLISGPGIARKLTAFGGDIFLLDGRSFRDSTMFGWEQENWLRGNLRPGPTWLVNGSLFFGAYGKFESFEGDFPANFKSFLGDIRTSGALTAFVSGDLHYSEIMDLERELLGYSSFEIVSSSIHSLTVPGLHEMYPNPRRREAESSHNFVIFEGDFSDDSISGEVTAWNAGYDPFSGAVRVRR